MFVDAIARGLGRIAKEHGLNGSIIEGAIRRLRREGADVECVFVEGESSKYRARLVFRVPSRFRMKVPYSLELEEKATGHRARIVLFRHSIDYDLVYRCSKINVGRHTIRFIARKSYRSRLCIRHLPEVRTVSIAELTKLFKPGEKLSSSSVRKPGS